MTGTMVRILVVDDERPIRRFLNASLSGQYTILEAATGEEALAMTISGRPDVTRKRTRSLLWMPVRTIT